MRATPSTVIHRARPCAAAGARSVALLLVSLLLVSTLAACGGAPRAATAPDQARGAAIATAPAPAPGLTLERWFVPFEPAEREQHIAAARNDALLEAVATGLEGDGLLVFRAKRADLGKVQAALGGTYQVHSTLLGELPEWADVETARIEPGRTVFISGRPRTLGEQVLRLWLRGWTFPTVDGGRARIELRLTLEDIRGERLTLDPTTPRARVREIDGSRTVTELAPDEALVLLERPVVPPDADAAGELAVPPPPQVGALLLAERGIEGRATVLIVTVGFVDILPLAPAPAAAPPRP